MVSFPTVSPPRPYTLPSPHPYAPHAQPISFLNAKVVIEGDVLLLPRATSWRVANLLLIIAVSQGIFLIYVSVFAPSVASEFLSVVVSLAVTAERRSQYPLSPLTHAPLIGQCEDIRIHLPPIRVTRTHL